MPDFGAQMERPSQELPGRVLDLEANRAGTLKFDMLMRARLMSRHDRGKELVVCE